MVQVGGEMTHLLLPSPSAPTSLEQKWTFEEAPCLSVGKDRILPRLKLYHQMMFLFVTKIKIAWTDLRILLSYGFKKSALRVLFCF